MKACCIYPGDNPDPTILFENGYYYITCSSLYYYPGLLLVRTADLCRFEPVCRILTKNVGDVWAPELVKYNGKFFIYFPANLEGHIRNFGVWSDQLESGWSDPILIGVDYQIDPGFVTDGKDAWLYFNDSKCAKLTKDGLHVAESPHKVKDPWTFPESWETEGICDEAPKLFYKNGFYYLITAQGGTAGPATSHMAVCFRARTPSGPWEASPYNPVIHTYSADEEWWSTGHATYFEDTLHNGYFIFHGYRKNHQNMGRQILLCRAKWTSDGFPIAAEIEPRKIEMPDIHDDFPKGPLALHWSFYRSFDAARFSLDNGLTLKGRGASFGNSFPMAVNAQFCDYEVSVTVSDATSMAGLGIFYNESANVGLYLKNTAIYLTNCGRDILLYDGGQKEVRLKMIKIGPAIRLYAMMEDSTIGHDQELDISDFQHNILKGYLSCRPALFSFGEGCAVFREFSYIGLKR